MIVIKILIPVYIILLGHSVLSSDPDDIRVSREYVPRLNRQRYNLNHPPAAVNYEPIAVAVVYEEEGPRKDKSVDNKVSANSQKHLQTENVVETKPVEKVKVSNLTEPKESNNDIHVKLSSAKVKNEPKSLTSHLQPEKELQIPVVVVYDEPQVRPNHKRRTSPARERVRGFTLKKLDEESITKPTIIPTGNKEKENIAPIIQKSELQKENGNRTESKEKNVMKSRIKLEEIKPVENVVKVTKAEPKINKETTSIESDQVTETQKKNSSTVTAESDSKGKNRRRERDPVVPIVESKNYVFSHNGAFEYSYEGGDGTKAFSQGELKTFGEDKTGESVVGGFSYTDKDGKDYSLSYTADENGYRPVGAHLPTPPPIPKAIARALRYLATKTTPEPVTEAVSKSDKVQQANSNTVTESVSSSNKDTKLMPETGTKTVPKSKKSRNAETETR